MAVYQDIYKLNYATPTQIQGADLNFTLELEELNITPTTALSGTVKDSLNDAIENAAVVLYDMAGEPLISVATNADGEYSLNYPAGEYKIAAGANWHLSSQQIEIELLADILNAQNFVLIDDPNEGKQVIYGVIKNPDSVVLDNVIVNMYNQDNELLVTTVSATDGEYVIHEIEDAGTYKVTFSKPGYTLLDMQITVVSGVKKKQNVTLDYNPNENIYTVSGVVVKKNTNMKLGGQWVGLYQMVSGVETMVKESTTNPSGGFIFEDLPNGNTYFPKAN